MAEDETQRGLSFGLGNIFSGTRGRLLGRRRILTMYRGYRRSSWNSLRLNPRLMAFIPPGWQRCDRYWKFQINRGTDHVKTTH
jgi:hypothetical protein